MTHRPRLAVALVVMLVLAAAVAPMVVPVKATYLNRVGSDTIEFRTASCGAPVASLLGADPELNGGSEFWNGESEFWIGGATSASACEAASAKRVIGALALLLASSLGWGIIRRRTPAPGRVSVERDNDRFL